MLYVFNTQCDSENADWWRIKICFYAAPFKILVSWRSLQEFISGPEGLKMLKFLLLHGCVRDSEWGLC